MPRLTIDLQSGFERDDVIIHVAGHALIQKEVSTRLQIGLAHHAELEVPGGSASVRIEVPARGASATRSIDVERTPFVGVNLEKSGTLTIDARAEPFRYA